MPGRHRGVAGARSRQGESERRRDRAWASAGRVGRPYSRAASPTSCGAAVAATASPRCVSASARDWPSYWRHERVTEELQSRARGASRSTTRSRDTPTSYLREPPDAHPPLDYPPYKSTALRHPKQPLVYLPQTMTEITGPQLGAGARSASPTTISRSSTTASRSASGSSSRAACSTPRASRCARRWSRSGRRTPPGATSTAGTAGRRRLTRTSAARAGASPTTRAAISSRRSSPGRTRGATTTTPGARRTSTSRCSAARSPSGWSRRCTSRAIRSSRTTRSSTRCAIRRRASGWSRRFSIHGTVPELGRRRTSGTSTCAARGHAVRGGVLIFETTPSQTVGPYFAIGLPFDVGPVRRARGHARARSTITGTIYDGAGEPDPRLPARDLAGRPLGPLRRHARLRRRLRARRLPRLRPLRRGGRRRERSTS